MLGLIHWLIKSAATRQARSSPKSRRYTAFKVFNDEVRSEIDTYASGVFAYQNGKRPNPPQQIETLTIKLKEGPVELVSSLPGAKEVDGFVYFFGGSDYIKFISREVQRTLNNSLFPITAVVSRGKLSCYERVEEGSKSNLFNGPIVRFERRNIEEFVESGNSTLLSSSTYKLQLREKYCTMKSPGLGELDRFAQPAAEYLTDEPLRKAA